MHFIHKPCEKSCFRQMVKFQGRFLTVICKQVCTVLSRGRARPNHTPISRPIGQSVASRPPKERSAVSQPWLGRLGLPVARSVAAWGLHMHRKQARRVGPAEVYPACPRRIHIRSTRSTAAVYLCTRASSVAAGSQATDDRCGVCTETAPGPCHSVGTIISF